MLNYQKKVISCNFRYFSKIALLFFISIVTFHSAAYAVNNKILDEYVEEAYVDQENGNLKQALSNFKKAIVLGVQDIEVYNDVGVLSEKLGLGLRAVEYYKKALRLDSNYLPAYLNLAYCYLDSGKTEQAFKYFKFRYELGDPQDRWTSLAREELLKIHPEYANIILDRDLKELNDSSARQVRKAFEDNLRRSYQHFQTGQLLFKNGDFEGAVQEYNLALKLTPKNPKILESRDKVYVEMTKEIVKKYTDSAVRGLEAGDTTSARNDIRKLLTTIPNN